MSSLAQLAGASLAAALFAGSFSAVAALPSGDTPSAVAPASPSTPSGASKPAARHAPSPPRAASQPAGVTNHLASAATAPTQGPAMPRLVAVEPAPQDDDDVIPHFSLYAVRDIDVLGLQFSAQDETTAGSNDSGDIIVTMTLRDAATKRMRDFSIKHMNEPMTLVVDGMEMLTATIRSELGGKFQLQMSKEKARLLFQRVLAKAGPAT